MTTLCFTAGCFTAGCNSDPQALLQKLAPLMGSTAVDVRTIPAITLAPGAYWQFHRDNPQLKLFDVTSGERVGVAGGIRLEGQRAAFEPERELFAQRDYELVLERSAIGGDCDSAGCRGDVTDRDGSEWPEEPLNTWPLTLRFSTRSLPQVRAVYFHDQRRLYVRFSQGMDRLLTGARIHVLDEVREPVDISPMVWQGEGVTTARFEILSPLDATGLYTIVVGELAESADGLRLDGNGNGVPGENHDDFTAQFTGSQGVIVDSRLK
ncbi:MAG: hypothetical protein JRH20_12015 [Deltaproteobacteria bacterium]|nr:hypothetical protein [Deltaproteobacteria bacterium]